ncbi:N-6 DNA methylase [Shewanella sp. GutDb-MelDb]|uniref:N-6 DNA methylase n=1 Tax=Shewanella sp. GutDb-MelDb TaxID=2058316 RepID=UPI000C7E0388|nr:N-6 DNA methylase [Shewanella sp. GutDb-MelDb]PKG58857.1 SAM-dependent methyltransferase [Shewanella sp. GutDb-MelDb]
MNPHSLPKKRELGAYYTPPALSQVLADWAIKNASENILEPSFGGCGFFDSSITRLKSLGCLSPDKQLFGVDIDQNAFDILHSKFHKLLSIQKRFLKNDFIRIEPCDFSINRFDVVMGNPPYVSMHNMTQEQRKSCEVILRNSPFSSFTLGRNASLWAFFLLHSLAFLKNGGRVAWVLPSSLLHAEYAKKLIAIHRKHFRVLKIVKLAERFFREEGAKETSVILIAEGFDRKGKEECSFTVKAVDNLSELKDAIAMTTSSSHMEIEHFKLAYISEDIREIYQKVSFRKESKPLSHYLDIKIGMVTGANKQFIINKETVKQFELPSSVLKPVVGRFSSLAGIRHTKPRQEKIQREGHRAFLVNPSQLQMNDKESLVREYLTQITEEEKIKNRTFKKRPNWFEPDYGIDSIIPDGFLSYMIHLGPRIVINQGRVNCTNSVHKVLFHDKTSPSKMKLAIAVSMLSTYSQFSAEVEGRVYSSGVLKIEPSAGKKIKILLSEDCIDDLNALIPNLEKAMAEEYPLAMEMVDSVLIEHGMLTKKQSNGLARGVHKLRCERYKGVNLSHEK